MTKEEVARRAKELLDDEVLTTALALMEKSHLDEWKQTNAADCEKRELCFHKYSAVEALRQELRAMARQLEVDAYNKRRATSTP